MISIEEKELIPKIQKGDQESFEILYKKYAPRILRFVNRMIQSVNKNRKWDIFFNF